MKPSNCVMATKSATAAKVCLKAVANVNKTIAPKSSAWTHVARLKSTAS